MEPKPVAFLVIDMQVACFPERATGHHAQRVVRAINEIADAVRSASGHVVFIQHDGEPGDPFEPASSGWELLPSLDRLDEDLLVRKRACDSFYETGLEGLLRERNVRELLISGYATDFCVDTTVRAAMSLDFQVIVAGDAHTTVDRPHLEARSIVEHHHYVWDGLLLPRSRVRILKNVEIVEWLEDARTD